MKPLKIKDKNIIWFTSDTHFGHENIIKFCSRPFKDANHMDEVLIQNWNSVVDKHDIVIHAGDFCWGDTQQWLTILNRLNGIKVLVKGNHDKIGIIPINKFQNVYQYLDLQISDDELPNKIQKITVCHFPMLAWEQSHRGSWNLFGHWHSDTLRNNSSNNNRNEEMTDFLTQEHMQYKKLLPIQYDVGVDGNNFTPISYNQIKKIITNQSQK